MPVPRWVFFDLYGTLLDPARLVEPWGPPPDHRPAALAALDDAIMQASIDTAAGEFQEFARYLEPALARRVAMEGLDPERAYEGVRMASKLSPFPDARPALARRAGAPAEGGLPLGGGDQQPAQGRRARARARGTARPFRGRGGHRRRARL